MLGHFALGEGFALVVLTLPDNDGARLCREELETVLHGRGLTLTRWEPPSPDELSQLPSRLLAATCVSGEGAIWIAAVTAQSAPDYAAWQTAWRRALEGLNQQRNPLRRNFGCPVIVVGSPWILPLFRDVAPDLWSVRSQVVRIEPGGQPTRSTADRSRHGLLAREPPSADDSPDPELALRQAERLKARPGRETDRARLLLRASLGLRERGQFALAEPILREAEQLAAALSGQELLQATILHALAHAVRDQGRAAEAEPMFRRALALAEEGGAVPVSRGITLQEPGRAIHDQGRAAEAEAMFRCALALAEEGGDTLVARGITLRELASAIRDQGRATEAEAMFRRALALAEEGGDTPLSRGITLHELARAIHDQGRAAEAEVLFRRALALKEEGGDTPASRGITLRGLARAIHDQGRAAEPDEIFRRALALQTKSGETPVAGDLTFPEQ